MAELKRLGVKKIEVKKTRRVFRIWGYGEEEYLTSKSRVCSNVLFVCKPGSDWDMFASCELLALIDEITELNDFKVRKWSRLTFSLLPVLGIDSLGWGGAGRGVVGGDIRSILITWSLRISRACRLRLSRSAYFQHAFWAESVTVPQITWWWISCTKNSKIWMISPRVIFNCHS